MKNLKLAVPVMLGLFAAAAFAEQGKVEKKPEKKGESKMQAPKPGPEVKKLAYFVGNWKSEGELKENPFGMPPGKYTSRDSCSWFSGGFQVVCRTNGKSSMGQMHGMGIMAYNPAQKAYTYYGIDNTGMAEESKGSVEGDNWTFTADEKVGDKSFHGRYSMTASSPDAYTFKYETSEDGTTWTLCMEGKSTKVKAEKKSAPAEKKS
jgi:hypothetical protein